MTEPRSKAPLAIAIVAVGTLLLGIVAVWTVLKKPASQAVQTQASMPIVAPRAARVPVQRPQWIWTSEPNTQEAIFTRAFVLEQAAEVAALVVSVDNEATILLDGVNWERDAGNDCSDRTDRLAPSPPRQMDGLREG